MLHLCVALIAAILVTPSAWAQQTPSNNTRESSNVSSITAKQTEAIEGNANLVRDRIGATSGVDFNFTPESVKWLDGYIERIRTTVSDPSGLSQVLGSYLGEAIRRRYGCTWIGEDGQVALQCEAGFVVFPFNKVARQLANGSNDSIFSFYETIPVLLAEHRAKRIATKK